MVVVVVQEANGMKESRIETHIERANELEQSTRERQASRQIGCRRGALWQAKARARFGSGANRIVQIALLWRAIHNAAAAVCRRWLR